MPFLQAGAGATTPSNPDYRFALHTREGVRDQTGIGTEIGKQIDMSVITAGVKEGGELIKDVYQGYVKADLQNQIQSQAIDPFIASRTEAAAQLNAGISENINQQKPLANATSSAEVQKAEPGVYKETQLLSAGFKQGRMTQQQFELKLAAITKSAVARNPGFTQQLINHAQQVTALSGVRLLGDPRDELAQAQTKKIEARTKRVKDLADKHNVDYDVFRIDDDEAHQRETWLKVQAKQHNKSLYEAATQQGAMIDITDKYTGKQADETMPSVSMGGMDNFHSHMQNFVQVAGENPDTKTKEQLIADINAYKNKEKAAYLQVMTSRGVPAASQKVHLSQYNKALDESATLTIDRINGKMSADMYKNNLSMQKSAAELSVRQIMTPEYADAMRKLGMNNPTLIKALMGNETAKNALAVGIPTLMNGLYSPQSVGILTSRSTEGSLTNGASLLQSGLDNGATEEASQLVAGMKQLTVDLKGKWGGDIGQKIEAQRSIINVLSMPKYKNMQALNEEGIRSAVGLTADFMHDVGRAFTARKQALSEDGYTINTVVGENGLITIQSPDAPSKDIDDLNKKYATAWNSGVKAVANMHNSTWNETSQLLSEQHGATWGFAPGTNPLQGAAPTKNRQQSSTTDNSVISKIIGVESGGRADAKNPNSSATGLGQFTSGTWLSTISKHAPELTQGKSQEEVLALRTNPNVSKQMLVAHVNDNKKILSNNGITPSDDKIYLAHFLGANAAVTLLSSPPETPVEDVVGRAAINANKSILAGKTVGDVIDWAKSKMGVA
jgi:hypothetical protein